MSHSLLHHRGQMSEAFRTVMFLSASGGLQDAYTYIGRGKVFANAQTGNIVLMSQSLFEGDFSRFAHYFIPVLSFALGVAAAECIRRKVHGYPFASTMCIGNLRSGMDSLVAFGHTRDKSLLYKALHYFGVILVFALGAGVGTQCVAVLGAKTIWLSCALLAVSLCFMFIKEDLEG